MKLYILQCLLCLFLFSCKKNKEVAKNEHTNVEVNYKQCKITIPPTISSYNQALICFDSLYSDSRCPINVNCIWEGYVHVGLSYKINNQVFPFQLSNLNRQLPGITAKQDTTIYGVKIKLVDVLPYPNWTMPFNINDYKVQLQIVQQ